MCKGVGTTFIHGNNLKDLEGLVSEAQQCIEYCKKCNTGNGIATMLDKVITKTKNRIAESPTAPKSFSSRYNKRSRKWYNLFK